MITARDPSPFVTRPIAFTVFAFVALSVVGPTEFSRRESGTIGLLWRWNGPSLTTK